MTKIRLAILGAGGRMGKRILELANDDPNFDIVGACDLDPEVDGVDITTLIGKSSSKIKVSDNLDNALQGAQVVVDFTNPVSTLTNVLAAYKHRVNMVIGTTGFSEETMREIERHAEHIAILQSPNMSAGVNFLFELVSRAAEVLGERYDIEITETHHRMKKDAPSGTALELARLIALVKGWDPKKAFLYGRHGETGERKKGTVALHALRGGDVVGEHTVSFLGDGEILELVHRATSRDAFARGALLAAKFVARRKSGLYNMRDVLKGTQAVRNAK